MHHEEKRFEINDLFYITLSNMRHFIISPSLK